MFQLPTEARLRAWRDFRLAIDAKPFEQALQSTVELWHVAPFTPYYLDPEDHQNWPSPWQLIEENIYCDIAKCLGIMYTVLLTRHGQNLDVELRMYQNKNNNHEYNLAWFNQGKYIANLIDQAVVNKTQLDESLKFVRCYSAEELKIKDY